MQYRRNSVILPLIGVNVVVFIIQMILGRSFELNFMLIGGEAFSRPWILVTHMFMHSGINHLVWNMYGILLFGGLLEGRIGWKRVLLVYFGSGIFAGIVSQFFYSATLGASGALMGLIGALIILMPKLRLLFFFFIPMRLWVAGIIWAAIDLWGVFFPSGTGNIAHLVGMGVGLLYGLYLSREKVKFQKKFQKKTHLDESDMQEYLRSGRI